MNNTPPETPRVRLQQLLQERFSTAVPSIATIQWNGPPTEGVVDVYFNTSPTERAAVIMVPEYEIGTSAESDEVLKEIASSPTWNEAREHIGF